MIKILKHGNKRVIECKNCGCIFEYEHEDVKREQSGINEYIYYISCPDCNKIHNIKAFVGIHI